MGACHHIDGVVCDNCRHLYDLSAPWRAFPQGGCEHCYCKLLPADTARPVPHKQCCKCHNVMATSFITFSCSTTASDGWGHNLPVGG